MSQCVLDCPYYCSMLEQISLQFGTSQRTPNFYHPTAINLLSKRKPWTFFESIKYILLEFPLSHRAVGYTVYSTQYTEGKVCFCTAIFLIYSRPRTAPSLYDVFQILGLRGERQCDGGHREDAEPDTDVQLQWCLLRPRQSPVPGLSWWKTI